MKHAIFRRFRWTTGFLFAANIAGCHSSSSEPARLSNAGQYVISWTQVSTTCAPQALPTALTADATQYAQVPLSPSSFQVNAQIRQRADTIAVNALDASGNTIIGSTLTGAIGAPTDPVFLTRTSSKTEGARTGGHTFQVTELVVDTAVFYYAVRTPPGQGTQISFLASGADIFVFRDGGPTGSIFTTCAVTEKLAGSNVSS